MTREEVDDREMDPCKLRTADNREEEEYTKESLFLDFFISSGI